MKNRLAISILAILGLTCCWREPPTPTSSPPTQSAREDKLEEPCCEQATDPETTEEALRLIEDLEPSIRELENKLAETVERDREALGEAPPPLKTPERIGPRPTSSAQMSEVCAANGARFVSLVITVDTSGSTGHVEIKTSSGHEPCDQLIKKMLKETRWEPCDAETSDLTCIFPYHLSFSEPRYGNP